MKEEIKQISDAVLSHPKTSWFVASVVQVEAWWIKWGNPTIDFLSSILGLGLVIILLLLNYEKWKEARKNNESDK